MNARFKKFIGVLATLISVMMLMSIVACGGEEANNNDGGNEGGGSLVATFYDGDTVLATKNFESGARVTAPANPKKDGYLFEGWYKEDGSAYAKTATYSANVNFYAKWLAGYVLEAEDTQLINIDPDEDDTASPDGLKLGYGRSGNMFGENMIGEDAKASGGKFVRGIQYTDAHLDFVFNAEEAGTAKLYAAFACEFKDYDLTSAEIGFEVNGDFVAFDSTISLKAYDLNGGVLTFADYYIAEVSLKKGENVIRLVIVNENDIRPFPDGTVYAPSPIVDCLKLYSASAIEAVKYNNFDK